jgi:hypothetical protein
VTRVYEKAREWTCSLPGCGKQFVRCPAKVKRTTRAYCSPLCAKRGRAEIAFPLASRTQVVQRYLNGEQTGDLAREFGVSSSTIRTALRQNGVTPDRSRAGQASWARRMDTPPDEGDIHTGFRWCSACGERKSMSEYYWQNPGGGRPITNRARQCRSCKYVLNKAGADLRANRRKYNYGLTREQFDEMIVRQDGRCAICRNSLDPESRDLHVDHCHFDKQIRGLLCGRCNTGLGLFRDDPDVLKVAAEYIINTFHWHPPLESEHIPVTVVPGWTDHAAAAE